MAEQLSNIESAGGPDVLGGMSALVVALSVAEVPVNIATNGGKTSEDD
jgi:hypothetical protein